LDANLPWKVTFYREENGFCPLIEFLNRLSKDDQMYIQESIRKVAVLNIYAREPLVKHLEEKLYELRAVRCTNTYRLIYFISSSRQIVFLHGFHKKTQKFPRRDLVVAKKRYEAYVART